MSPDDVTVLIPAYNEASRVRPVVDGLVEAGYAVLVVDDASTDDTADVARDAGADVLARSTNQGYLAALKRGFEEIETGIVVTLDADGEHRVSDVPALVEPVQDGEADLVFGARQSIPRPSERLLNRIAGRYVPVSDTGTGFRALRTDLARELSLETVCTCGTFALEAAMHGATIEEVPIETASVDKPRGIAWGHVRQLGHALRYVVRLWRGTD